MCLWKVLLREDYLSFSSVNTTEIPSWDFLVLQKVQSRRRNPFVSLSSHSEESACLALSTTQSMMKLGHIITLIFWEVKCLTFIHSIYSLKSLLFLEVWRKGFFFYQIPFFLILNSFPDYIFLSLKFLPYQVQLLINGVLIMWPKYQG